MRTEITKIMKICKVPEYGQSTYIHRWPLLVLTTFCFLLQQIRKWTTRMRIWLTCDFSTGQNHLKQDSYPNVWAPKLFLFPPRVPRLREGRQSAERKAALTRMNTVTTNKIGSAFPWILFLWFPVFADILLGYRYSLFLNMALLVQCPWIFLIPPLTL